MAIIHLTVLLIAFPAAIMVIWYGLRRRDRLLDIEKDRTPIYSAVVAARTDTFGLSYPFVRLALYEDLFVLTSVPKVVLAYNEIDRIEISSFMMETCTCIYPNTGSCHSALIRIYRCDHNRVIEIIEERRRSQ